MVPASAAVRAFLWWRQDHRFGDRLEHVVTVLMTYQDGATETLRFEGPTDWDVKDGRLVAWNETGDVVAERDNVDTALYHRTLTE